MRDPNPGNTDERVRTLLLEADDDDALFLEESLAGSNEIEVERVRSLKQALRRLAEDRHDAVLFDPVLHEADDTDPLTTMLALHPDVAVVLQSWVVDEAAVSRAIRAGAQDYLTKHATRGDDFVKAIRCAVDRARREASVRRSVATGDVSLRDRLGDALGEADRRNTMVAVCSVIMSDLPNVRGTQGAPDVEQLLTEAMHRVRSSVRRADAVGRVGCDRVVTVLGGVTSQREVSTVARRLMQALQRPFRGEAGERRVDADVGIALYPEDGLEPRELIHASLAAAKQASMCFGGRFQFRRPARNAREADNQILGDELRRALESGELELHYQPKIEGASRRAASVEALLRWNHPGGMIPPQQFLPLAEETGLILPLGEWVAGEVCRQIRAWESDGISDVRIAINLSPQQLLAGDCVDLLLREIGNAAISPERLQLEVAELGRLVEEQRALRALRELRAIGVQIVVDDFGISSPLPSHLLGLPVDEVKIARPLVHGICASREGSALVGGMVSILHGLGHRVIAEGVESEGQLRKAIEFGCDGVQGFFLRRPAPARELTEFLRGPATKQP